MKNYLYFSYISGPHSYVFFLCGFICVIPGGIILLWFIYFLIIQITCNIKISWFFFKIEIFKAPSAEAFSVVKIANHCQPHRLLRSCFCKEGKIAIDNSSLELNKAIFSTTIIMLIQIYRLLWRGYSADPIFLFQTMNGKRPSISKNWNYNTIKFYIS